MAVQFKKKEASSIRATSSSLSNEKTIQLNEFAQLFEVAFVGTSGRFLFLNVILNGEEKRVRLNTETRELVFL